MARRSRLRTGNGPENGATPMTGDVDLTKAVLAYLSRYTHRVAISNQRLVALDEHGVTFRWKDYRVHGHTRNKTMTLAADEFVRRFLLHVLPGRFHRIRHYGLLANPSRRANLTKIRELLSTVPARIKPCANVVANVAVPPTFVCRHCGSPMIIIDILQRSRPIRAPPVQRAYA
jgi:Putative transposase